MVYLMVVFSQKLDSMILDVFSNLSNDSMAVWSIFLFLSYYKFYFKVNTSGIELTANHAKYKWWLQKL